MTNWVGTVEEDEDNDDDNKWAFTLDSSHDNGIFLIQTRVDEDDDDVVMLDAIYC